MDLVHRTSLTSSADVSFDPLTRTLGRRLPRRRAVSLLAATLATGLVGTMAVTDAAAKSTSQDDKASQVGKNKKGGTERRNVICGGPPPL